jgi:hypothetical protein
MVLEVFGQDPHQSFFTRLPSGHSGSGLFAGSGDSAVQCTDMPADPPAVLETGVGHIPHFPGAIAALDAVQSEAEVETRLPDTAFCPSSASTSHLRPFPALRI